jgi:hypothetical protein
LSQIYKAVNNGGGVVDSITGIGPIEANGFSGVPQTGNVSISITGTGPSYASNYTNIVGPTTYVATATDFYLSCDSTLGLITIQLPDAPTANRLFVIKDRTGAAPTHNIDITTVSGTDTIDIGETIYDLTDAFESVELLYHSGNYEIF